MPTIAPEELIGRTFLKETEADGQHFRACVVRTFVDKDATLKQEPEYIKFICEVDGDTADAIFTYNQILDHIEQMIQNNCINSGASRHINVLCVLQSEITKDQHTT
jgi:hypothetical protein